jgi:hypothetical protein
MMQNKNIKSKLSFKRDEIKIKKRAKIIEKYLNKHEKIPSFDLFKYDIPDTDIAEWKDIKHLTKYNTLEDIENVLI